MASLFFSIITDLCLIILFENDNIISTFKKNNKLLHSDNFIKDLNELLFENKLSLSDLTSIYFISEPGGQTGYRVSVSFLTAMSFLSKVKIFSISSLLFQKGKEKNCFSAISKNSKNHIVNYYKDDVLLSTINLPKIELIDSYNKEGFPVFINLSNINFIENFFSLKDKFSNFEL